MDGVLSPILIGLSFGMSLGGALALTPLARRLAHRLDMVDRPDGRRKLQIRPVALLGGVAVLGALSVGLATLGALGELGGLGPRLPWLLSGLVAVCVVGVADDAISLSPRLKFLGQLVACLPLVAGDFTIHAISFGGQEFALGPFRLAVSLLWFVTCINAFNLVDGMDGLASTVGLWIALAAAAVGAVIGVNGPTLFALAMAGALTGFLKHNRPPATIYLGDAGSMTIGLATAVVTLLVAEDAPGVAHVTVMLALLAIPLADLGLAVWRRSMSGTGFWHADRGHMHHRLQETGLTNQQVLGVVTMLLIATGSLAVASRLVGWERLAWGTSLVLAVSLVRSQLIGHHEWLLTKSFFSRRWFSLAAPPRVGPTSETHGAHWSASDVSHQLATAGRQLLAALAAHGEKKCQIEIVADACDCRQRWVSPLAGPFDSSMTIELERVTAGLRVSARVALADAHRDPAAAIAAVVDRWMQTLIGRFAAPPGELAENEAIVLQHPAAAATQARRRRAA